MERNESDGQKRLSVTEERTGSSDNPKELSGNCASFQRSATTNELKINGSSIARSRSCRFFSIPIGNSTSRRRRKTALASLRWQDWHSSPVFEEKKGGEGERRREKKRDQTFQTIGGGIAQSFQVSCAEAGLMEALFPLRVEAKWTGFRRKLEQRSPLKRFEETRSIFRTFSNHFSTNGIALLSAISNFSRCFSFTIVPRSIRRETRENVPWEYISRIFLSGIFLMENGSNGSDGFPILL